MNYFKHESAIIDDGAQIGKGTKIWHWSHISSGAVIGEACSLGQNVYVGNKVRLGKNCKIQNNVSIYDNVHLDDDVFCGPSMVFTNVINPRAAFVRKDEYKVTTVSRGVTIGANATIVCGITLGEFCFIGAGSVVTKDVLPFALVTGVPGKHVGWMSRFGQKIPLPLRGTGSWQCPHTQDTYELKNDKLELTIRGRESLS